MRLAPVFCLLSSVSCLFAAVDGTVMNITAGTVLPGASLSLLQPGAGGMQTLATTTSDAQGKFSIDKDVSGGPALVQATFKDVTYTLLLQPGAPTTGLQVSVYDTTTKPAAAKLSQHIIILEPSAADIQVTETFLLANETDTTFSDPDKGSVQIYVAGEPQGLIATIEATAGIPIKRPLAKTGQAGMYKLAYAIKPGEQRIDVTYTLPAAKTYKGKLLRTDGPTRLVTASPVTLTGDAFKNLGQEPRTQAHIYEVTLAKVGANFAAGIDGIGSLERASAQDSPAASQEDSGAPQAEAINARVYTRLNWVLGLAFGILALGGTLLYRRGA